MLLKSNKNLRDTMKEIFTMTVNITDLNYYRLVFIHLKINAIAEINTYKKVILKSIYFVNSFIKKGTSSKNENKAIDQTP